MIKLHLPIARLVAVAVACLALVAAVAASQDGAQVIAGANNFHRLDADFASGGLTTADAFAAIKRLGFKTVVNLRAPSEQGADIEGEGEVVRKAGMRYVSLPFASAKPDDDAVAKFLELARNPWNLPLYVHCVSAQRANTFWLIKRVLVDRWPTEKALAEWGALGMENTRLRDYALAYLQAHPAK
jgi:uncharacterized protein (TIGR01244 family)